MPFSSPGLLPDPTFYPSPRLAAEAPPETLAYVASVSPLGSNRPDALEVVDLDPSSADYGRSVGRLEMPYAGDELHHFGWNACSSALCPYAPHPHVERRYLIVPGLRSSRIYIIDTKPDPRRPTIAKVLEPDEVIRKSGYSRPHTVHCGPEGIYVSALGSPEGKGPGGVFLMDHTTFEVVGPWERDRGPQHLAYDAWWHLTQDVMITSEWGTPDMIEGGLNPELLMQKRYGRNLHFWDLRNRRHLQAVQAGEDNQITLELRPAHDPTKLYGFAGVVVSLADLSSSVWLWHRPEATRGKGARARGARAKGGGAKGGAARGKAAKAEAADGAGEWVLEKVIEVPAEPADPADLPPALQPFKAVPPLVSDIDLSVDDRFLYVSCWGTGELRQYDVTDPFRPRQTGSVRIGGIVGRRPHPRSGPLNGGPQMVEVSRDGRRVYFTNSLYLAWDEQFYPEGIGGWMAKVNADPNGGMALDRDFFMEWEAGRRPHQVRLQGGDASSDSYCFP